MAIAANGPLLGPEVQAAQRREQGPTLLVTPVATACGGGHYVRRLQEPILSEEPFSPGELELQHHRTSERRFHVQSVAAPRRLTGRRLADWVYARTILDAGFALEKANYETAESELSAAWEFPKTSNPGTSWINPRLDREAELANACYEAGLMACYLAGRLSGPRLLDHSGHRLEDQELVLPAGLAPGVLDRGPVDLARFFFGLLLDADLPVSETLSICGDLEPTDATDSSDRRFHSRRSDRGRALCARCRSPARSVDPRPAAVAAHCAVRPFPTSLLGTVRKNPGAGASCQRVVCASAAGFFFDWTIGEAHARCVAPRQGADFSRAHQARDDSLHRNATARPRAALTA